VLLESKQIPDAMTSFMASFAVNNLIVWTPTIMPTGGGQSLLTC
jgi:hypothetical protein